MINIGTFFLIIFPLICGFVILPLGKYNLRKNICILVLGLSFLASILLKPHFSFSWQILGKGNMMLGADYLSRLVLIFANLFGLLVCLYSKDYIKDRKSYFSWFLWLVAFANLEILAVNFFTFNLAWLGSIIVLYFLLRIDSKLSAQKALTILGFSYICFIIGSLVYSSLSGSSNIESALRLVLDKPLCWVAFILLLIGALAKSGCAPFHTWIPAASVTAPVTIMAILPASLDKLLGIYILSRVMLYFFALNEIMVILLLIIGSLTIIFAVMMALIQHDLRKLLSYHAISQVGYMVLGLATANPIGIIGGIFHMFNHTLYKSGLFLVGGAVAEKRGTFELDKLGGLARYMPLTFVAGLIFSLSISGIPPFNGFASKWMIYQGVIIGLASNGNIILRFFYMFALIAAMFGSALTLASFIKFIHAIFLGQDNSQSKAKTSEASWSMLFPLLVLSALCILLGVFSKGFIRRFIAPSFPFALNYSGSWNSVLVAVFIVVSLIAGFVIWNSLRNKRVREDEFFSGGETEYDPQSFPATEFYKSVPNMPVLSKIYSFLQNDKFDLYNILKGIFIFNWARRPKK
jgi:formate hydrogenlyase subunit 3/multisubunit Na+/H+ antiporter MnhD subunit